MRKNPFNVLFVCTGNQCRSPMAQGILEGMLRTKNIKSIQADSAGTHALSGLSPTEEAVRVAKEKGLEIAPLRSKPLSESMVSEADLILVMSKMHRAIVRNAVPSAAGKVFLLKSFGRDGADPEWETEIDDPTGGESEEYVRCFDALDREVKRILPAVQKMAERKRSHG